MIDKKIMEPGLPKLKVITDDGAERLVHAIVMQAVRDYQYALIRYNTAKGRGRKQEYRNQIGECERFFKKHIAIYCGLDGEVVMLETRRQAAKKLWDDKGIRMEVPKF